jgi:MSHA biogenesis protein MshL
MKLINIKLLVLLASLLFVGSCNSPLKNSYSDTNKEIKTTLQKAIKNNPGTMAKKVEVPGTIFSALAPQLNLTEKEEEAKFDIAAQNQNAVQFFTGLAKGAGISMMISPDIDGDVTLDMHNVTLAEILGSVRSVYGYEFIKTSYGYDVLPATLETRIFTIDRVNVSRAGTSSLNVEIEGIGESGGDSSTELTTTSEDSFWDKLESTITLIIAGTDIGSTAVVINPDSGIVVVRAYPQELRKVAAYLDATQGITKRQVIIEAKILEVTLNDKFASGINWHIDGLDIVQTAGSSAGGLPAKITSSFFADQITGTFTRHNSFQAIISMLASQGKISVISSPRIATLNNQKAVIKVGSDEYYATNLSSNTTTATATTTSNSVNMESFFSGVALDVTPQIDSSGSIMLHIHPMISIVEQDEKSITVPDGLVSMPMAKSTIRESDSVVTARSGQVVVIGGLMQRSAATSRSELPVSDSIGAYTDALGAKSDVLTRTEVVILLRPVIVNDQNTAASLQSTINHIDKLR